MGLNEVLIRVRVSYEREKAANLEQWRMVRRLCYVIQGALGFDGTEQDLWAIEGDGALAVREEKLESWRAFAEKKMIEWREKRCSLN